MKITSITYGKTINIGNYQSIRVDFTADISPENETVEGALQDLKFLVHTAEQNILRENPPIRK